MWVQNKRKIISSYDVVFDEKHSNALAYMSQPYSEAVAMRPAMTCTPCDTYFREHTDNT